MGILRITDWDKHFECSQSRNLKRMAWVPVRIKLAGDGYTQLLDHPNGAAHFGGWIGLVEVGATCEPRGTLLRGNGKPHDVESLSRITRIPVEILAEAIPRLLDIGWLEHETAGALQDGAVILRDAVAPQRKFVATGHNITVQDKTENPCASSDAREGGSVLSIDEPPFETTESEALFPVESKKPVKLVDGMTSRQEIWWVDFWGAYWLKRSRKAARQAFAKQVRSLTRFQEVMAAVQAQSPEMLGRQSQHRPQAATWLRGERWADDIPTEEETRPGSGDAIAEAMRRLEEDTK